MAPRSGAFDPIVVPLDGSAWAEHALPVAEAIARATRARLRLVLVHQLPPPPGDRESRKLFTSVEVAVRKGEREYLRRVAARLKRAGSLQVTAVSPSGPPGPALVRYLEELGAGLVVMATHGRGAIGRALLGSVADYVVREARAPVILVRPPDNEAAPARWTAREILVPLDGSPLAETAIAPAAELARAFGAKLDLVQIVVPISAVGDAPLAVSSGYDERLTERRLQEAQDYLDKAAARLRGDDIEVTAGAVVAGSAAGALVDLAWPGRTDLVVIASHGRTGLRRVALGSVADKLVRTAATPVLVVRARGRR